MSALEPSPQQASVTSDRAKEHTQNTVGRETRWLATCQDSQQASGSRCLSEANAPCVTWLPFSL